MVKSKKVIASIEELELSFNLGSKKEPRYKKVIDKSGFDIIEGEILAIIGESGSGKSVITSTLTGLNSDSQYITHGKIILDGQDVTDFTEDDWQESGLRGKTISQVFQNPLSTLNPTKKVGKQVMESMLINGHAESKKDAMQKTIELFHAVRIKSPMEIINMYPHQLSGGMIQRIVIVSIIACEPKIIIFDEPTTALDPSIQAEIIEIIREINKMTNTSIIFITHDLGVVASIADRIAIMYAGRIIEVGLNEEILFNPKHPYTWGLISSMPEVNMANTLYSISGQAPPEISMIEGDAFAPRNEHALKIDFLLKPPMYKISNTHYVWSWLYSPASPKVEPPKPIIERQKLFNKSKGK